MTDEAGAPSRLTTIFAKRPVAGLVKTRLVPPLTEAEAAELAEAMLADTVERSLRGEAYRCELCVAPSGAEAWFRERFPGVAVRTQRGDGLAARLASHFEEVCDGRGTRVVLGGDAPQLEDALVVRAHEALEAGRDVVLGPDEGGGYYLVGLRRARAELFTRVPMSTRTMCEETAALATRAGLEVELLPRRYDVDLPEDLARLARELAARTDAAAHRPERTARLIERLRIT